MNGPATARLRSLGEAAVSAAMLAAAKTVDVPNDDWPYLYLESRKPSWFYVSTAAMLLIIAVLAIDLAAPGMFRAKAFDAEMLFYGAAFLLLETRLVTQMALLWGETWFSSAFVFASILLTFLLGIVAMMF